MSIHSEHPFLEPESRRDPVRRLRGRLGGAVSLWTSGTGVHRAGLTVSSLMVAPGEPGRVLGLVDPDSDLALAVEETGTAVVQLLSWEHRDLADVFAGVAPAPGGAFRSASWEETEWGPVLAGVAAWAGIRVAAPGAPVGWSVLLDGVVEHVEIGPASRRGPSRWCTGAAGTSGLPTGRRPVACGHRPWPDDEGARRGRAADPVMVVDDHPMWREGVARDLAEAGFEVVATASTGTEAVTRAAAVRPRVVVLDLQIPAPTGVEVTATLVRGRPDRAGADPVGVRRAGRRAGGGQGRRDRLPGQVGVAGELLSAVTRVAAGRHRLHPGAGRAGAGGVPPALRRPGRPAGPTRLG